MANYWKFDGIMDELLTGENGTTSENFSGASLGEFAERQDLFWDSLLQYLQNENDKSGGVFGIRQNIFPDNFESVIEYINDNADLIDNFLDGCLTNPPHHWNESFQRLLTIYRQYFIDHGEIDSTNITVNDILNANAGNTFNNGWWVKPWTNTDGDTYTDVRNHDKIRRVLNDDKFLQFTHKLFDKYIRLLMPEYERTVEIEDLNRNFWVIGQVLTGILSFLFDEDSPINDLFNGMLDELAQLWENLLYLWVAFALISQALRENDIVVITIPVNNFYSEPYVKFDDFQRNNTTQLNLIWNKLKYLKNVYNRSTLVIIPEVRQNAYLENYYARVSYPGVIIYNRKVAEGIANLCPASQPNVSNQERVEYIPFNKNDTDRNLIIELGNNLRINGYLYQNNPWGLYEDSPRYHFKSDFTDDSEGLSGVAYVAAIRTVFDVITPPEFVNGELTNFGISVSCIDVAKELGEASDAEVYNCEYNLSNDKLVCENEVIKDNAIAVTSESKEIVEGWYRGEVASWIYRATPSFIVVLTKNWENLHVVPVSFRKNAVINIHGVDTEGFVAYDDTFIFDYPDKDESESLTLPLKGQSNNGHIIDYTFTEESMGSNWVTTVQNDVININSANNEAIFTNRGKDTETETENLFTS